MMRLQKSLKPIAAQSQLVGIEVTIQLTQLTL